MSSVILSGNWSNLQSHLKNWHSKVWDNLKEKADKRLLRMEDIQEVPRNASFPSIERFFSHSDSQNPNRVDEAKLWRVINLIETCQSFRSLQSSSFIRYLQTSGVDQSFYLTSYEFKTLYFPAILRAISRELKRQLSRISAVSLTYDSWTDNTQARYLTVTIHWCDPSWQTHIANLCTLPWTGSMTGYSLSAAILKHVNDVTNPNCLIFSSTTDGGYNMTSAGKDIALREALSEQCVQFGESAKGLKLDVMTRWNSTYLMIVRFTTMFRCLDELHWFNPLFKEVDRPKGEKDYYLFLVKLLKPFYDITMIAQKRKGTSIHLIPHWTHHLTELLQDMIATSAKSEEIYLSNLLLTECLKPERFGRYTRKANLALCAAALSPKFGSLPFGFVTQELREEVWEMMYQHSKELLFPESSSSGTSPDNNECPDQNLLDSSVLDANQFDQIRNCLRLIRTFWQRSFRPFTLLE